LRINEQTRLCLQLFSTKEISMKSAKLALALLMIPAGAGLCSLTGCGSEPSSPVQQKQLENDSQNTLKDLEVADPTLADKVKSSVGYAIFPQVGKGAVGIEAGSGNGEVFQNGKYIGAAHLSIGGVGLSLGGETYQELILFNTPQAIQDFENNNLKFGADASAVALQAGSAASATFDKDKGVLVFKHTTGGLMFDASLNGQQFTFKAANPQPATQP
jgi:lipid-binding SYLF domain-containing protein